MFAIFFSDKDIQLPWQVDGGEFQCMLSMGAYLSYDNRLTLGRQYIKNK